MKAVGVRWRGNPKKGQGERLHWLMVAQNGAGSIATMVSPARTILAVTAAGLPGKEGHTPRKVGTLVLAVVAIIMVLLIWIA